MKISLSTTIRISKNEVPLWLSMIGCVETIRQIYFHKWWLIIKIWCKRSKLKSMTKGFLANFVVISWLKSIENIETVKLKYFFFLFTEDDDEDDDDELLLWYDWPTGTHLTLFPVVTIVKDSYHCKSLTLHRQD